MNPAVLVSSCEPDSADACLLVEELSAALAAITGDSGASSFSVADVRVARSVFAVARDQRGDLLGCAALRPLDGDTNDVGEVKRMYARPGTRGVGAALLAFVESQAGAFAYQELWLETRKVNLRAVAFYQRHGYVQIDNYGKYVGREDAICLGKRL